jgi:hypothetical protein
MTLVKMEVRTLLILKQLEVRVIDEVHNLLTGSPREPRVIIQLFRHLGNELKASLLFLGIPDAREALAFKTVGSDGGAAVEDRRRVSEPCGSRFSEACHCRDLLCSRLKTCERLLGRRTA